jgi:hypothetical protein
MILEWYLLIILHNAPFGTLQGPFDSYQSCQTMADDLMAFGKSVQTPTQVLCAVKERSLGEANKRSVEEMTPKKKSQDVSREMR